MDTALQGLPGVAGAAAAVRTATSGHQILVGYVAPVAGAGLDLAACRTMLRSRLPAALVPTLAVVGALPTRGSGKVDRDALPWPLEQAEAGSDGGAVLPGTAGWLAEQWTRTLGVAVTGPGQEFFDDGGGSLAAAQLVSLLRQRYPGVTVADVYDNPRLGDLARVLDEFAPPVEAGRADVAPTPRRSQMVQSLLRCRSPPWSGGGG